jgi:protein O-GlcNAc transferase
MSNKIMKNEISEKKSSGQSAQESKEAATQGISISLEQALRLALHDFQEGNILQAEQLCQQILHLDADNAEANHLYGNIAAYQEDKIDMAVHYIKKAIQRDSQNVNFHYSLGNILNNAGRLDEAIVCFKNTIAIKPDFAGVQN